MCGAVDHFYSMFIGIEEFIDEMDFKIVIKRDIEF